MQCGKCGRANEADAVFCENCGLPLGDGTAGRPSRRRAYLFALLLVPVLLAAAGFGYYQFILPNGVAAVVNGEEISLAELDAAVRAAADGRRVPEDAVGRMRYAVLSGLVTERIACQEARTAGIVIPAGELDSALARTRAASGMDDKTFNERAAAQYGSMTAFQLSLERRLMVNRFIAERLMAGADDPGAGRARVDQWLQDATGRATVRIALAEQVPASGCGCCGGGGNASGMQGCERRPGPGKSGAQASQQVVEAREAALAYWRGHHGAGPVETKETDFGCHVQVDILQNNRIARSLRYQNGAVTEM